MELANSLLDSTLAASKTPAMPEALSFAPGLSDTPSNGSVTLLSISPDIITKSFGLSDPLWIAITFTISVRDGIRLSPDTLSEIYITSMQPLHKSEIFLNSLYIQRVAAPMPRWSDTFSDKVCRVPKFASLLMSCEILLGDTSDTIL